MNKHQLYHGDQPEKCLGLKTLSKTWHLMMKMMESQTFVHGITTIKLSMKYSIILAKDKYSLQILVYNYFI
jgi:uncharacterized membrane protein YqiK